MSFNQAVVGGLLRRTCYLAILLVGSLGPILGPDIYILDQGYNAQDSINTCEFLNNDFLVTFSFFNFVY